MKLSNAFSALFSYAGKWKYLTFTGCILSVVAAVLGIMPYIFIYKAIEETITGGYGARWGYWALFSALLNILVYIIALMLTHIAAFNIAGNIRIKTLDHVRKLPMGFFNANQTGRIRKIIDYNSGMSEDILAHKLPDAAAAIISPIVAVVLLLLFSPAMGLCCLITMALSIVAMFSMMGGKNAGFYIRYQKELEKMSTEAVEYVRGIPVVKTFNQTVWSFKAFHKTIKDNGDAALAYALSCRKGQTAFLTIINGTFFLLIPVALILASRGNIMGVLINFIFYSLFAPACGSFLNKLVYSSEAIMQVQTAMSSLEEIMSLKEMNDGYDSAISSFDITFENVSFTYPGRDKKAVDSVSLTLKEGTLTALVGPSGGGKSTIASLAARFYDADEGSIKIGGKEIKTLKLSSVMDNISTVFQDPMLLKGTIAENVCMGREGATRQEILSALSKAQCDDIIARLPNGIDTVYGTEGTYLSGGEKQRIAIARAILKNSPIVILDEATAFADAENESLIQKAIRELTKGRTVLMIAHRLSSITDADNIIVIDEGRLVESGDFDFLMKRHGLFEKMYSSYMASTEWRLK